MLDRQLQDAVYQIEHAQGVVKAIDKDSRQLASALVDGTMIVITTLQKFPFVMRGLLVASPAPTRRRRPVRLSSAQAAAWRKADRRSALRGDRGTRRTPASPGESAREMKEVLGSRAQDARG